MSLGSLSSAGLGLFFRFETMEGFCFLQKQNPERWVLSYWKVLGIAGKWSQVFSACPSPHTQSPALLGPLQEGMFHPREARPLL